MAGACSIKRNLVFIHGSGGSGALWAYQAQYFSQAYHVVAVDLPGHGRNRGEPINTIPGLAEFVISEILRLGLASPIVAGHSLGSAIALQLALDHAEALSALVVVGGGARLKVLPSIREGILTNHDAAVESMASYAFAKGASKAVVDRAATEMRKVSAETLLADLDACNNFDVMQRLGGIQLPTLAIVGQEDFMTPVKYSEFLKAGIPGANLEVIPNAGHMVMIEQPYLFNAALDKFLSLTFPRGRSE